MPANITVVAQAMMSGMGTAWPMHQEWPHYTVRVEIMP